MDFIHEHPSASLWKADLEDAFQHVIVAESDARLMGIHFDAFALQAVSPLLTSHSNMSHYLDDFFGASDTTASPATPIQVLSLSAAALGFKLSHKKTIWDTTKLEILGIEFDSVTQTASTTQQRRQCILQLCSRIIECGHASLLKLQQKDIHFLEALAILEALHHFSPLWAGPRRVVVNVDNTNIKYGLCKGSIHDPQSQVLFRAIFALCLWQHIDLIPIHISSKANVLADTLSRHCFTFIQQQYPQAFALLRFNTVDTAHSPLPPSWECQVSPPQQPSSFGTVLPPAPELALPLCAQTSPPLPPPGVATPSQPQRPFSLNGLRLSTPPARHMARSSVTSPSSSLGTSTSASPQSFLTPNAWPELSCPSQHNHRMFCAAFCLAFASFLHSGELTWEVQGTDNMLMVSSISFAAEKSFVTVTIPASKTDPFWQGAMLTAPAIQLSTCAISALDMVRRSWLSSAPLFILEGDRPFDRSSFVATLH
ncbi:uncharacterized protein UBRO_20011 [Ustilago bromivora]|nr:uncharacterized protein UBRO_20011 [Ustilago bromivora]